MNESLRTFLIAGNVMPNAGGVGKIQFSKIQQETTYPLIWYQRSDYHQNRGTSGTKFLTTTSYDLEVISTDPDEAQTISDAVRILLDGYQGLLDGSQFVQMVEVMDVSDDYTPFNADLDNGVFVSALSLEILS